MYSYIRTGSTKQRGKTKQKGKTVNKKIILGVQGFYYCFLSVHCGHSKVNCSRETDK